MFSRRNAKSLAAVAVATILINVPSASFAGNWMNDWISSSTSSGPSYFNGQARGYLSGGSFSARWPVSQNNNLISVTPPKLSAGCGGIDFYGGSLSFLSTQNLVKKLQNVLQNSAGVAFQMALDTLCSKCVTLMNSMEDISNKLNQMSMDDCKAAKGVVLGVRSASEDIAEGYKEGELSTGIEEGLSDSYKSIKDNIPAVAAASDMNNWMNTQKGQPQNQIASLSGCPADIAVLFPSDSNSYPVSVLGVLGNQMGIPTDYTDLLRGLVGDLQISNVVTDGGPGMSYIPACSNNADIDVDDLMAGDAESQNAAPSSFIPGHCYKNTSANASMQTYVQGKMQSVSDALANNTSLSSQDVSFITQMPVPMLYGLRMAIATGQQGSLMPSLAAVGAAGMSMKAVKDLLARYEEILAIVNGVSHNMGNPSGQCKLSIFQKSTSEETQKMRDKINSTYALLVGSYQSKMTEFTTSFALNNQLEHLNDQLKAQVAKTFGHSVAQRAMRTL